MSLSSKAVLIPSIVLLIGTVPGTSATNAFTDDPFKNKIKIDTEQDNTNSCDESQQGDNNSGCSITDTMTTDTFTVEGEKNKISLDFDEKIRMTVTKVQMEITTLTAQSQIQSISDQ